VGVVDTGVDFNHPNLKHAKGEQNLGASPDPHGTWVAGVIASNHSSNRGISPGVALINYALEDWYDESIISATNWVLYYGAHIINVSLGKDSGRQLDDLARVF
jgi:subtilisin family serine protease